MNLKKIEQIILEKRTYIEVLLASAITVALISEGMLLKEFSLFGVVTTLLAFIILLETIRMAIQYILKHHIQVRLIIDAMIIFFLRDALLVVADKGYELGDKIIYSTFYFTLVVILFCFRFIAIKQLSLILKASKEHNVNMGSDNLEQLLNKEIENEKAKSSTS